MASGISGPPGLGSRHHFTIHESGLHRMTQNKTTLTWSRVDLAVCVSGLTTKQRGRRPARDLPSFIGVVVASGVHLAGPDRPPELRIEYHDVGVVAHRDLPLAAQTGDARRRGREHVDQPL